MDLQKKQVEVLWVTVIWLRIGTSGLRVGRGRNRGMISGRGKRISSSVGTSMPAVGPSQFPIQRNAAGAWCGLSASSAEVKNAWSYVSTVPYGLLEFCLIKDRQLYRREQCQVLVSAVVNLRVPSMRDFLFCRLNILFSDSTVPCGVVCGVHFCKLISTMMYIFCQS